LAHHEELGERLHAPRDVGRCSKLVAVRWLFLLAILVLRSAVAETLSGTVVNVIDGDTVVIQDDAKKKHTVRLAEIDAPERRQPYWKESAVALARLCFKKEAKVEWTERDEKKRLIGYVTCDGKDANGEQLRRGMAWGSPKGARPTSGLLELEAYARLRKIGLWKDDNAVPPWEFAGKK
jgi:endonuclease YncB( thermonuclease family)